jgi:hypothetical protein
MEVALYIYSPKYQNISTGFTADLTDVTVDTTLSTVDATLVSVEEGFFDVAQRIELFKDERISITSSVQDIADVSKAKTDFTQSFTIPASQTNNIIFKHWYESAIDGGFDQRRKYNGFIEIDTIPFREGGFALNSVNFKNNKPASYNIIFFGNAKSIKDLLKEDKLSSLDFSDLNHAFAPSEVISRITSNSASVAYPLFAHDRLYSYDDASATDVTTNTGAIVWNSLFPAVSLSTILQKIEDKYGLTFTGAFTNYVQFSKLWMLFKNAERFVALTEPQKIDFTSKESGLNNEEVNLTTDEIGFSTRFGGGKRIIRIRIEPTDLTIRYVVLIYKNGVLFNSFSDLIGNTISTFFESNLNSQNVNDKYTLFIQSEGLMTYKGILRYYTKINSIGSYSSLIASGINQTTIPNINISTYAPELKLIDLINGLIKMFNLVFIPIDSTTFEIIPLELYYNNGKFNDISGNIITDDIEIRKTSMYKNINFKYQKSEAILNNKFNELFTPQRGYDYGDLTYEQIDSLESSTFSVDLPFENTLFERKTDSSFQTITFKNRELNNYVPKPLLMYDNGLQNVSIPIKIEGVSFTDVTNYRRFSNDIDNAGLITLNWGEEVSSWQLDVASNGLYQRHYQNYLGNIFNLKGRLLVVKCKFTSPELTNVQLNDRIVIRDKRYTINKLNADLTTGETTLELLTDYRDGEVAIGNRYSSEDIYFVSNQAQTFEIMLLATNGQVLETISIDSPFVFYDEITYSENTILEVTILENTTGIERSGVVRIAINEFQNIEIPIIQSANLLFGNEDVNWGSTLITFNN